MTKTTHTDHPTPETRGLHTPDRAGDPVATHIDALPKVRCPPTPTGFVRQPIRRGLAPKRLQVRLAPAAAEELRTHAPTYLEELGKRAPLAGQFADALTLAGGWSAEAISADEWRA